MDQNISFVTIATTDVEAARAFYSAGLGWSPLLHVPGEVLFYQVAPGVVLSLFAAGAFARDIGQERAPTAAGLTLAQNFDSPQHVDAAVEATLAAGARIVKAAGKTEWGGYHGLVADPNGLVWEFAHNPGWRINADGSVSLAPVQ